MAKKYKQKVQEKPDKINYKEIIANALSGLIVGTLLILIDKVIN